MDNKLLTTDRIVRVDDFGLLITDDYNKLRRNVNCTSSKLKNYIQSKNISANNFQHIILITQLVNTNIFDDIKIVSVDGYY